MVDKLVVSWWRFEAEPRSDAVGGLRELSTERHWKLDPVYEKPGERQGRFSKLLLYSNFHLTFTVKTSKHTLCLYPMHLRSTAKC